MISFSDVIAALAFAAATVGVIYSRRGALAAEKAVRRLAPTLEIDRSEPYTRLLRNDDPLAPPIREVSAHFFSTHVTLRNHADTRVLVDGLISTRWRTKLADRDKLVREGTEGFERESRPEASNLGRRVNLTHTLSAQSENGKTHLDHSALKLILVSNRPLKAGDLKAVWRWADYYPDPSR